MIKSGILVAIYLISPEDISEHFCRSHHCKNLKFEDFGESSTSLGELQGSLPVVKVFTSYHKPNTTDMGCQAPTNGQGFYWCIPYSNPGFSSLLCLVVVI